MNNPIRKTTVPIIALVLGSVCFGACHQNPPPETTVESAIPASFSIAKGGPDGARSCEPWGYCGCWQGCAWVELVVDADTAESRYRVLDGEFQGMLYQREHNCYPDEGPEQCFEVCTGDGENKTCVDGLVQMLECTGSCVPQPPSFHCEMIDGKCSRIEN